MRPVPTISEHRSVEALVAAFKADNHSVRVVDRIFQDRPDALLEIDNRRIACECVQIPPAYIFKQLHRHHREEAWGGNDLICTSFPNEPHQWIAEATRKKSPLINDYLHRTGASEVWLLVHTPPNDTKFFMHSEAQWLPWALRHGTKMALHHFSQIYLWTPEGGINPISYSRDEGKVHSELGIGFSNGYPTLNIDQGRFPITTTSSLNDTPNIYTFEHRTKSYKVVRPRDKEYAKHSPARRDGIYHFSVTVRSDSAQVQMDVEYPQEGETFTASPMKVEGLKPATEYFYHYIYEYHAPRHLQTSHVFQPR